MHLCIEKFSQRGKASFSYTINPCNWPFSRFFLVFPMKNVALNETAERKRREKRTEKKSAAIFSAAKNQRADEKSKTHAQQKGNAREKFNLTNHSRVITWKMNSFFPPPRKFWSFEMERYRNFGATNNWQFVHFNFCVRFEKKIQFYFAY